jgi:ABC-2 type transport system permease protein
VWLNSVFWRSLRGYRVGILGWGAGMGLVVMATMASVGTLITTPEAREQLVALAGAFSWNASVVAVDTVGGAATWKIGIVILLIAVWPVLAASRLLRGEEERGSLDVLLSLPRGRMRVALEKLAALWTALTAAGLLVALIAFAGGQRFGADFGFGGALLFGLNLTLICAVMAGVALFVSQFTLERSTAATWAGGLLLLFVVLDMVHRVLPGAIWVSRVSPVYYFNLSKPLVPSYGANSGAMLLLLGLALALQGASLALLARRDIGGVVGLARRSQPNPRRARSAAGWSLGSPFGRAAGLLAAPAGWWTLAMAAFAAWMIVVIQQTSSALGDLVAGSPAIAEALQRLGGAASLNATFLSAIFMLLPVMVLAFAVSQVSRWAADEEEGRLELLLATPQPRWRVIAGRYGALACAIAAMCAITLLAAMAAAAATGLALDYDHLAAAALGMIPLALLLAAIGYLAAGWLRTAADTGLLSFVLLAWFFVGFIGPELNWPDGLLRLSAFYYYGQPLLHGLALGTVLGLLAAAGVALAGAVLRFAGKDLAV